MVKDSTGSQFSTWEPTSNQQRHSDTNSPQRVTNWEQRKASSKKKRCDSSGIILLKEKFEGNVRHTSGWERNYLKNFIDNQLSIVKFERRKRALFQKEKKNRILPFVITQYHSTVPNIKEILMSKWHLINQQPLLREIFQEPSTIS